MYGEMEWRLITSESLFDILISSFIISHPEIEKNKKYIKIVSWHIN